MEENRQQRIDLVWAAVFMSCIATVALALLFTFASGAPLNTVIAMDLVGGWILSVLAVVLLLTLPIEGKALLAFGRIVIWLALLTLLIAGGLGVLSIAGVG